MDVPNSQLSLPMPAPRRVLKGWGVNLGYYVATRACLFVVLFLWCSFVGKLCYSSVFGVEKYRLG